MESLVHKLFCRVLRFVCYLFVFDRQLKRRRRVLLLLVHIHKSRDGHVVPHELEGDVLPAQFVALVHQCVLDKDVFLADVLVVVAVNIFDDLVPDDNVVDGFGRCLIAGHDVDEELLDVPVEGRVHVGVNVETEEGPINPAMGFQRSEGL